MRTFFFRESLVYEFIKGTIDSQQIMKEYKDMPEQTNEVFKSYLNIIYFFWIS